MSGARRFLLRLLNVFRPARAEPDLAREVAAHLALLEDELQRRGLTAEDAHRAARLSLGGVEQAKELHRDARSFAWLHDARRDLQYALRTLGGTPGFVVAVVLTLALGIGANTAIFSLANAVLLQRLPVPDPKALVLFAVSSDLSGLGSSFPYPFYRQVRDTNDVLTGVLSSASMGPSVETGGRAEWASGELVSGNYFDVLGVRPYIGRLFTDNDDRVPGAHPLVVLTRSQHGVPQRVSRGRSTSPGSPLSSARAPRRYSPLTCRVEKPMLALTHPVLSPPIVGMRATDNSVIGAAAATSCNPTRKFVLTSPKLVEQALRLRCGSSDPHALHVNG